MSIVVPVFNDLLSQYVFALSKTCNHIFDPIVLTCSDTELARELHDHPPSKELNMDEIRRTNISVGLHERLEKVEYFTELVLTLSIEYHIVCLFLVQFKKLFQPNVLSLGTPPTNRTQVVGVVRELNEIVRMISEVKSGLLSSNTSIPPFFIDTYPWENMAKLTLFSEVPDEFNYPDKSGDIRVITFMKSRTTTMSIIDNMQYMGLDFSTFKHIIDEILRLWTAYSRYVIFLQSSSTNTVAQRGSQGPEEWGHNRATNKTNTSFDAQANPWVAISHLVDKVEALRDRIHATR